MRALRSVHRGAGLALWVAFLGYLAVMTRGAVPGWLTYLPLLPLAVLALTGLVLWIQPYLGQRGR